MMGFWFAKSTDPGGDSGQARQSAGRQAKQEQKQKPTQASGEPQGEGEEEEDEDEPVNAMLADLLPWAISILFHAGLVLLTSFLIWAGQGEPEKDPPVAPNTSLSQAPTPQLTQSQTETETQSSSQQTESSESSSLQSSVDASTAMIGANMQSGQSSPFGSGTGDGDGDGMFGGGGGGAPTVVFVIDASGSLVDSLPIVLEELRKTINEMHKEQKFTVIFFRGGSHFDQSVVEVSKPRRGMKPATSRNKEIVTEWLTTKNIQAGGETRPLEALRQALNYEPALIVLLSDNITGKGIYQISQDKLLSEIKKINKGKSTINTIQFLYPDPLSKVPGKKGTLKLIAEQTGGKYKFVDAQEAHQ